MGGGTCHSGNCMAEVRSSRPCVTAKARTTLQTVPCRLLSMVSRLPVPRRSLPMQTAAQAAHYPFFGIWGPYRAEMDPWQLAEAEAPAPRKYLWHFYNQTAHYLENQV